MDIILVCDRNRDGHETYSDRIADTAPYMCVMHRAVKKHNGTYHAQQCVRAVYTVQ